ncbi:MAG: hypothetical protein ACRBK7_19290 [Acidimicrobiales bacterium]
MTTVEQNPATIDQAPLDNAAPLSAADEAAALEWLHEQRCTDGLPVIIPTQERVDRLVLASGMDGALSLGIMGPGGGDATVNKIAANAVMAGCIPDHMPVVIAAVQAVLKPEFDLGEMQGTTHCTAPFIIVNGPARQSAQVVDGFGALGPGHRANASIGRALRLCMINIGMARAGESDMALLGHSGKFTFCLAESEEVSPWEPQHTDHGYHPEQSSVTIVGAEPPHSVIFSNDADDPTSPERLLRTLAMVMANIGSNNAHFRCGAQTVILNPEHAQVLAEAGMSRADVKQRLKELAVNPASLMAELNPAFASRGGAAEGMVAAVRNPDDIVLLVAGGAGLYSTVMPSWGAGAHNNPVVHAEIIIDQSCEIPAR